MGTELGGEQQRAATRTLAEKLNHLFATVHPSGRGEFTLDEVAEAINKHGETSITAAYLSQLRRGQRTNPSKNVLEALAWFFGVSPAYFFNDELAGKIEAELGLVVAMRRASVQQIALRAAELSEESLRNLSVLIEHWQELERSATVPGSGRSSEGRKT